MGSGTEVAIESAGITLLSGDLMGLTKAIQLSRATMRNIRQNLFFAFVYNSLGIPLAAGALCPAAARQGVAQSDARRGRDEPQFGLGDLQCVATSERAIGRSSDQRAHARPFQMKSRRGVHQATWFNATVLTTDRNCGYYSHASAKRAAGEGLYILSPAALDAFTGRTSRARVRWPGGAAPSRPCRALPNLPRPPDLAWISSKSRRVRHQCPCWLAQLASG